MPKNIFDSIPTDGGTATLDAPASKNVFDSIPADSAPASAALIPKIQANPSNQPSQFSSGYGNTVPISENPDYDLTRALTDPNTGLIAKANKGVGYAGNLARGVVTDAAMSLVDPFNTTKQIPSGNTAAALRGDTLPQDETLKGISGTNPTTATAGKIAQGLLGTTPLLAAGGLPALGQKLVALGFSADMISKAPKLATDLGAELGKNPQDRDADKLTSLISDAIQTGLFAPLAGAHGLSRSKTPSEPPQNSPNINSVDAGTVVPPAPPAEIPTVKDSSTVQNPNEEVISPSNPPPLDTAATPPEAAPAAGPNAATPNPVEPLNDAGLSADELAAKYGVNERGTINLEKLPLKVQPALKIDGKVYTGGDTHYDIKKSLPQDVQDEYTMAPDVDAQHIFLDQDGNELSRTDLQKAIGVSNSEDIPAANKIPKSLTPDEISAQTGANYDGEIKNSAGEPVKGFTFKNPTHPLKGVTFNLKGDVTPEVVDSKLKELNDRFSGDAEHTIQEGEGGKFNIVNPSGKTLETFPNRAEAEKVLPEYNTPGIPSEVDKISKKQSPAPVSVETDKNTQETISELKKQHDDAFDALAEANAKNDEAGMASARAKLSDISKKLNESGQPLAQSSDLTSLKNSTADIERVANGLPEASPTQKRAMGAAWEQSGEVLKNDPTAGQRIADEVIHNPERGVNDSESALLLRQKVAMGNALRASAEKINDGDVNEKANFDRLSNQFKELLDAIKSRGSEWGREGRWRQALADEDFSFQSREQILRAKKGGAPLTDAERETLLKQTAEHERIINEQKRLIEEKSNRIRELEVKSALDKIALESRTTTGANRGSKPTGLISRLEARATAARERINNRPAQLNTGLDPAQLIAALRDEIEIGAYHVARIGADVAKWSKEQIDKWSAAMKKELGDKITPNLQVILEQAKKTVEDASKPPTHEEQIAAQSAKIKEKFKTGKLDEVTTQVENLVRLFVQRGITGRDALVDAVHGVLKESDPEITRREAAEAISGYGRFKQLSKDEISKTVRDIKGQLQQVLKLEDIQSKKPPLKSGVERRNPSDEERRLIQQVNEAKRQHGVAVTDPATQLKSALESRKTAIKNQITDLEKQISDKEKFVKTKTPSPSDAELVSLKEKRDSLKKQFDDIFNPGLTDAQKYQKALEADKKALEKSIAEKQRKLVEGDLAAKPKEVNRPADPTLEPLKQRRDALNKQLADARKKPSSQKYAEALQRSLDAMNKSIAEKEAAIKSGDVESKTVAKTNRPLSPELEQAKQKLDVLNKQIEKIRNPKKSDSEIVKSRLEKRINELEEKLKSGDFSTRPKRVALPLDKEAQALQVRKAKLEDDIKTAELKAERAGRNKLQKITGAISNLNRVNILSHLSVLEHLSGAAIENIVTRPIGTVLAQVARLNGTLDAIRKKAIYEGDASIRSEFKGITGLLKSSKALKDKLFTGSSELDWLHKGVKYPKEFLQIVQNVHGAIKEPVRQSIYARSMQLRTEAAEKMGLDPARDEVLSKALSSEAYADANMDIFMGDNFLSKALHGVVTGYLRGEKSSPGLAKFTADVLDILFPIVNVSTNLAIRKYRLLAGLPEAATRIGISASRGELKNGAEKLTPLEAERITRAMKYGLFGIALGVYAWYHPQYFGGIYVTGKQAPTDKKTGLKTGEIALPDGGHISHHLAHGPVGGYMNLMADARRLYEKDVKDNPNNKWSALSDAAFFSMYAGTKDLPAFATMGRLTSPFKTAGQKLGELVKNIFVAGAVQDVAEGTDKNQRSPKNFEQEIAVGIPGLRQTVPTKKAGKNESYQPPMKQ